MKFNFDCLSSGESVLNLNIGQKNTAKLLAKQCWRLLKLDCGAAVYPLNG